MTRFTDVEDAVAWANDSDCGLASSARGYGITWVNTHFMLVNDMPHGGVKSSGYGKDMSMLSRDDDTVARHVMVKL